MNPMNEKAFRVIIAGTRDFADYDLLCQKCDSILSAKRQDSHIIVVSGTARGADRLGERYARERGYEIRRFPADWDNDGNSAGPIRNAKMADNADALIAFWDGKSRGTRNMIETAEEKGLLVRKIMTTQQNRAMREDDSKVEKLRQQTAQYAIEHITGKGMHTGVRWLQDSFNGYFSAIGSTKGMTEESLIGHRQILAQRVAIDCIHALDHDQLKHLDKVLEDIAKDARVDINLKR